MLTNWFSINHSRGPGPETAMLLAASIAMLPVFHPADEPGMVNWRVQVERVATLALVLKALGSPLLDDQRVAGDERGFVQEMGGVE